MGVTVKINDNKGDAVGHFLAEDNKSFSKMAKENNIQIITSCGLGACGICKCKIISGHQFVQVDKMGKPRGEISRDSNGNIATIFTCLAGVKSKYLNDGKNYEIILQKNI